jgi:hypothetical protein
MQAWNVYLAGRLIDTVFANGYTADEMRRSLIDHDGYDSRIVVRARRPTTTAKSEGMAPARATRIARGQA